jgi:aspartyl-tRNA(Asn)/glutamyl-tRNA(Gln) amidotransferase subunit B
MNSFRFLERGVNAEIARQEEILRGGGQVEQETLHFDPRTEALTSLRSKEEAHDYRYFPEPDLVPIAITDEMLEAARSAMPELPAARAERLEGLGLGGDAARLLAFRPELGDQFEAALAADGAVAPAALANWIVNEEAAAQVEPGALASLVGMVERREVSHDAGRQVLAQLAADGGDPAAIVEAEGLGAIGGGDELAPIVEAALAANPDVAEKLRGGDMKPIGVIVGHVMRETRGRADGTAVTRLVREQLGL